VTFLFKRRDIAAFMLSIRFTKVKRFGPARSARLAVASVPPYVRPPRCCDIPSIFLPSSLSLSLSLSVCFPARLPPRLQPRRNAAEVFPGFPQRRTRDYLSIEGRIDFGSGERDNVALFYIFNTLTSPTETANEHAASVSALIRIVRG